MADRLVAHFSGDVQGVGFRFTTVHVARKYNVTGYVRNLADGRVELVAEGPEKDVTGLLKDVRRRMSGYIRDVEARHEPATGEFAEFGIAR